MVCSSCKSKIEGEPSYCPICGNRLEKTYFEKEEEKKNKNIIKLAIIIFVAILVFVGLLLTVIFLVMGFVSKEMKEIASSDVVILGDTSVPSLYVLYGERKVCGFSTNTTLDSVTKKISYCSNEVNDSEFNSYKNFLINDNGYNYSRDNDNILIRDYAGFTIQITINSSTGEIEYVKY